MNEYIGYLPLLNLLNVPIIIKILAVWIKTELRIKELEIHKHRVEIHLGFDERREHERAR